MRRQITTVVSLMMFCGYCATAPGQSEIHLGGDAGSSSYTLSNGVINVSAISVDAYGTFTQWGGTTIVNGPVSLSGGFVDRNVIAYGTFALQQGSMSCSAINMDTGSYTQGNATNVVSGDITIAIATHSFFYVNGGELRSSNVTINDAWVGGFFQSGGVNVITNQLSIAGNGLPQWSGFVLSGGELNVRDIVLNPLGQFTWTSGALKQRSGLTMLAGQLVLGSGTKLFGRLSLGAVGSSTGSLLTLPTGDNCIVRFAASSSVVWSNSASLTISNWSGSLTGGGLHQIIVGGNSAGLSQQQVMRIFFVDPSGLSSGTYPARILSNGEIVPDSPSAIGNVPTVLSLSSLGNGSVQLHLKGAADGNYRIETSTDMTHWSTWTNLQATGGTMSIVDTDAANHSARFYRALLQ